MTLVFMRLKDLHNQVLATVDALRVQTWLQWSLNHHAKGLAAHKQGTNMEALVGGRGMG